MEEEDQSICRFSKKWEAPSLETLLHSHVLKTSFHPRFYRWNLPLSVGEEGADIGTARGSFIAIDVVEGARVRGSGNQQSEGTSCHEQKTPMLDNSGPIAEIPRQSSSVDKNGMIEKVNPPKHPPSLQRLPQVPPLQRSLFNSCVALAPVVCLASVPQELANGRHMILAKYC